MFERFYAAYSKIPYSDIAVFKTENERDAWVNFQDEFSIAVGATADNALFKRKKISNTSAERRIVKMVLIDDMFNQNQKWYVKPEVRYRWR